MKKVVNQLLVLILFSAFWTDVRSQTAPVDFENFRPVHIGGNWALNQRDLPVISEDYFAWMNKVGVNWIGISISMHLDNSLDSTIERNYDANIPTFKDDVLRATIKKLRARGFHVYLTLAFEIQEAETSAFPVKRYMLGNPDIPNQVPTVLSSNWPWAIQHPNHSSFIKAFFRSYTEQVVHFATIAQEEGVELFSLGTETEGLFRTRSDNTYWPNHFKNQLQAMVNETRKVYHRLLSYDMTFDGLTARNYFGAGSDHLWDDLGLDVVGISAYFPLVTSLPTLPMQVTDAKSRWSQIFKDHLVPLQERNPSKKILFLEFGYTNDLGSPYAPASKEFTTRSFQDVNTNGLDDGEETQANVYKAFFEINEANDRLVKGSFLWGNEIMNNLDYETDWNKRVHFGIREKLAESVVSKYYSDIRDLPQKPENPTGTTLLCSDPSNTVYSTSAALNAANYSWALTPNEAGTISTSNLKASIDWNSAFLGVAKIRVAGTNNFGKGRYSDSLEVRILPKPVADFNMSLSGETLITSNNSSNATSYIWDFDGKATSNEQNPTFTLTEPGDVKVTLQASNGACSDTTRKQITIRITAITEPDIPEAIEVYPNPVKDFLQIDLTSKVSSTRKIIRLFNALGQPLLTENTEGKTARLDLRQYSQGLYLLSIHDSGGYKITFAKILKE